MYCSTCYGNKDMKATQISNNIMKLWITYAIIRNVEILQFTAACIELKGVPY